MKIEWLVTYVTAVCAPGRAKRAILGVILAGRGFSSIQDMFVVREPFCDIGTSS